MVSCCTCNEFYVAILFLFYMDLETGSYQCHKFFLHLLIEIILLYCNLFLDAISLQMHEALKARLAAAADMRKAAEQEKLEKEESARNALAEQEAIMEKVVQESKILQEQAEENSKVDTYIASNVHTQLCYKNKCDL